MKRIPSKSKSKSPKSKVSNKRPAPPAKRARPPRQRAPSVVAPAENPEAKALAQKIAALVAEKKALDVVILDVRGKTSYADYLVVASGESERQVSSMADYVENKLKEEGTRPVGTEGYDTGHWVLLDYGEVVGHFFYTEVRTFYDLEGLWADAAKEKVA
jgi:ribosome-associated protein